MKKLLIGLTILASTSSFAEANFNAIKQDFLSMVAHRNIDVHQVQVSQGVVGKMVNPLLEIFEAGDPEYVTIKFKAKDNNINSYNQYTCSVYVNRSSIIANFEEIARSCDVVKLTNWEPEV